MYHQRHVIGRGPRRQITLTPTALAMMNSLTRTRKALVVCALVDISYATVDELFSRNFPQVLGQIRSRVIYLDAIGHVSLMFDLHLSTESKLQMYLLDE